MRAAHLGVADVWCVRVAAVRLVPQHGGQVVSVGGPADAGEVQEDVLVCSEEVEHPGQSQF